jgi:hypothetical protein
MDPGRDCRPVCGLVAAALLISIAACSGSIAAPPLTAVPGPPPAQGCAAGVPLRALTAARFPLDVRFAPGVLAPEPAGNPPQRVYQPDWDGPVLFAPDQVPLHIPRHRFCAVEGEWTVPAAKPTINCSNPQEPTDGSSLWIAIDGWSATFKAHARRKDGRWYEYPSTDILQAGSESDVPCYHGGSLKNYKTSAYFWIEWSGVRNVAVERHERNLPLHAGDTIFLRIAATTTGPRAWREATLWLVDETTGFYLPPRTFHSGCVDCGTPFHEPATLYGNTAEWMIEATFYDYSDPKLTNTLDDFGNVRMTDVFTTDQDGNTYDLTRPNGAVPNIDWMTWNGVPLSENGTLLACATINAPQAVTFERAPYVIATPGQQGDLEPKPKRCR